MAGGSDERGCARALGLFRGLGCRCPQTPSALLPGWESQAPVPTGQRLDTGQGTRRSPQPSGTQGDTAPAPQPDRTRVFLGWKSARQTWIFLKCLSCEVTQPWRGMSGPQHPQRIEGRKNQVLRAERWGHRDQ